MAPLKQKTYLIKYLGLESTKILGNDEKNLHESIKNWDK